MSITEETRKLEQHGLRHRLKGFPIYDDYGKEIIGIVNEKEWNINDLTWEQSVYLGEKIFEMIEKDKISKFPMGKEKVYGVMLSEYGIDCPHPIPMRKPLKHNENGFECLACGCWIIRKDKKVEEGQK